MNKYLIFYNGFIKRENMNKGIECNWLIRDYVILKGNLSYWKLDKYRKSIR